MICTFQAQWRKQNDKVGKVAELVIFGIADLPQQEWNMSTISAADAIRDEVIHDGLYR